MLHRYKIKGTPEVYTIAINSCSETGDWEFARSVYDDMIRNGVVPDEVILLKFDIVRITALAQPTKNGSQCKEKNRHMHLWWFPLNERAMSIFAENFTMMEEKRE